MNASPSAQEEKRIEVLWQYDVLDTLPEAAFDDLTSLAAHICQAPIALISLVDENRQWFKSKVGLTLTETSRDISFCAQAIRQTDLFIVPDATLDPRFATNPLVTADPFIRFYAGAPLIAPGGHALGTLCVIDNVPRELSLEQKGALRTLSRHVVRMLEVRRSANAAEPTAAQPRSSGLLPPVDQKYLNLFEAILDNSPATIFIKDLAGRYLHVNREFLRCFGRPIDKIIGKRDDEFLPGEQAAAYRANDDKVLQAGIPMEFEETVLMEDGLHTSMVSKFPLRDAEGTIYGICGIATDFTERKKLEEQLRQSQKMESIGQLAGGVAHDFNNILTVIQGHASLLQTTHRLFGAAGDSVRQIAQAAERAARLTRQLLTFSRREVMKPQVLNVNEVVTSMTSMLQRILGEDIKIQLNLDSRPLSIYADAGMMEQIILNLAVNSRDAMPKGGVLVISTAATTISPVDTLHRPEARSGKFACLTVTDTGCGMAPEIRPHIFEPFFTTKEVGHGTGLGLATIYGIVKQHLGFITTASEVGKGSTFQIYLPIHVPAPESSDPAPGDPLFARENETILVAEDETPLRDLVTSVLRYYGYRVLSAASGVAALKVWREHQDSVDLLLSDMVMPEGVSGLELAELLQKDKPSLKVIYTSGYSTDVIGRDFLHDYSVFFLQKPYPPKMLAETVRACLDGKQPAPR